jgi:outer membrane protein assembly factor BamD
MSWKKLSVVVLFTLCLYPGCRSGRELENLSAEDRYRLAKQEFDEGDYLQAIEDFRVITLQFPGSTVSDSAQFYLGESYFQRSQFLLAASEYENLIRAMSTSKLVPTARYQIGMCYYELSPPSDLDQKYTLKALDAFQSFIEYHPTNVLVPEAEEKIGELNTKLAKKEYDAGVIYVKMENYRAAERQFDYVLEKYHDTEYADRAHVGKIEAQIARKRYDDAKKEVDRFLDRYPTSSLKDKVENLKREIDNILQRQPDSKADGNTPAGKSTSRMHRE